MEKRAERRASTEDLPFLEFLLFFPSISLESFLLFYALMKRKSARLFL